MANGDLTIFNKAGSDKIINALDAYVAKIKSVSFYASGQEAQLFAKGSAAYNTIMTMIKNADEQVDNLVTDKLNPLKNKIEELNKQENNTKSFFKN